MQRGKLAVVFMLLLGLGLAVFAWQWNRSRGRQAAEYWGADAAKLIRSAKLVQAFQLDRKPHDSDAPPPDGADLLRAGDEWWVITDLKDVSRAPGLLHARNALLEDASFNFGEPGSGDPLYAYAVRFSSGDKMATIFFDPDTHQVRSDHRPAIGELVPKVAEGWRKACERYFAKSPLQPPAAEGGPLN